MRICLGLMLKGFSLLASPLAFRGLPRISNQGDSSNSTNADARSTLNNRSTFLTVNTLWMSFSNVTPKLSSSWTEPPDKAIADCRAHAGHSPPAMSAMAKSGSQTSAARSFSFSGMFGSVYGEEPKRWIKDFRGIDRYVALHYLVLFTEMYQDASFSLLERAATLLAKGFLELDNRLKNAGENLERYEVWRGPEYLQAYVDATKRYFGTKGQRDRFEKETRSLISGIDSKETT